MSDTNPKDKVPQRDIVWLSFVGGVILALVIQMMGFQMESESSMRSFLERDL